MDKVEFKKKVATSNEARLALLDQLIEFTKENSVEVNLDAYEFYLILDEAVTNSMEHGNRWAPDKNISIQAYVDSGYLIVKIRDEGIGFNPSFIINNYPAQSKSLSPRGRGIFIIRKFCDVSWNSIGNEITLKLGLK